MLIIGGVVVGAFVYLIGVFNVADDVIEHKSMDDYRKQYGKDLGLLVGTFYRSLMIGAWPVTLGIKYAIGVVSDLIRLVTGMGPKEIKKDAS
jgi:hypothetical protein